MEKLKNSNFIPKLSCEFFPVSLVHLLPDLKRGLAVRAADVYFIQ